jgi:hypothetical protein
MMEREEDGWPHSGTVEMPVDERPDTEGGTTKHGGHGDAVISV